MAIKNLADEIRDWLDDARLFLAKWREELRERASLASVGAQMVYRGVSMVCYYKLQWPKQEQRHAKALAPLMKRFAALQSVPVPLMAAMALWAARLETKIREQEEIRCARAAEIPK